jgi:hypothetical protein
MVSTKVWTPNGISLRDEEGKYVDTYGTFSINMGMRAMGLQVISQVDGFDIWTPKPNDRNPSSRQMGAIGTRTAWGFCRAFDESLEIPAIVLASESGTTRNGRVATTIVVRADNDITILAKPFEHAGNRMVSYDDVNGQMAADLASALKPGDFVTLHRSAVAGMLMYRGLTSPYSRDRRGPQPHVLALCSVNKVEKDGQDVFDIANYPAIEGFSGVAGPENLPTVKIDVFQALQPEYVEKLAAMAYPADHTKAPARTSSVDSSMDLDAILSGS